MCSEIDTLFFEEQYHPTTTPPKTFSHLGDLAAELRNSIYEQSLSSHLAANPSIKINAHGETVLPPLLSTSKQLRAETRGYHAAWLARAVRDATVPIRAQIRDYDAGPLREKLRSWSEEFAVPEAELVSRTKVSFIGNLNLCNVLEWVDRYLADPQANPVFVLEDSAVVHLPGHGALDLFSGSMSVVSAVESFRAAEGAKGAWKGIAREFLAHAQELGFGPGIEGREGVEVLSRKVFETIVVWHHDLKEGMRGDMKKKADFWDMGHVVFSFWRESSISRMR